MRFVLQLAVALIDQNLKQHWGDIEKIKGKFQKLFTFQELGKKKPWSWKDVIFLKCCFVSSLSFNCPSTEELNVRLQSSWQRTWKDVASLDLNPHERALFHRVSDNASGKGTATQKEHRQDGCTYFPELFSLLGGRGGWQHKNTSFLFPVG